MPKLVSFSTIKLFSCELKKSTTLSAILIPISEYSRIYLGGTGGAVDLILYGLILMIICIFRPDGLISFVPKDILERKKQR